MENLPTAVTSNQQPKGHLVLSELLILPQTFCKQIKGNIFFFFFFDKKMYIF